MPARLNDRALQRRSVDRKRRHFRQWKEKRQDVRTAGVVYFITDGSGFVKIGCTCTSTEQRLGSMQTSNPRRLLLLAIIRSDDMFSLERSIHDEFREMRHSIGEWFEITFDQVVECVARRKGRLSASGLSAFCRMPERQGGQFVD
jgi:hypothetical protein